MRVRFQSTRLPSASCNPSFQACSCRHDCCAHWGAVAERPVRRVAMLHASDPRERHRVTCGRCGASESVSLYECAHIHFWRCIVCGHVWTTRSDQPSTPSPSGPRDAS